MSDSIPQQIDEPIQGLTQDPVCSHIHLKYAKGFPEVSECKDCKAGFYRVSIRAFRFLNCKGIQILRSQRSFWRFKDFFFYWHDNNSREEVFNLIHPMDQLIKRKVNLHYN